MIIDSKFARLCHRVNRRNRTLQDYPRLYRTVTDGQATLPVHPFRMDRAAEAWSAKHPPGASRLEHLPAVRAPPPRPVDRFVPLPGVARLDAVPVLHHGSALAAHQPNAARLHGQDRTAEPASNRGQCPVRASCITHRRSVGRCEAAESVDDRQACGRLRDRPGRGQPAGVLRRVRRHDAGGAGAALSRRAGAAGGRRARRWVMGGMARAAPRQSRLSEPFDEEVPEILGSALHGKR